MKKNILFACVLLLFCCLAYISWSCKLISEPKIDPNTPGEVTLTFIDPGPHSGNPVSRTIEWSGKFVGSEIIGDNTTFHEPKRIYTKSVENGLYTISMTFEYLKPGLWDFTIQVDQDQPLACSNEIPVGKGVEITFVRGKAGCTATPYSSNVLNRRSRNKI